MDCFMQDLLRDKMLSVLVDEENNYYDTNANDNVSSDCDESKEGSIIDDDDDGDDDDDDGIDCCHLLVSDDDIISSTSTNVINEKQCIDDVGIGAADTSTSLHHHRCHPCHRCHRRHRRHRCRLSVAIISDNAISFAVARPKVFRRIEDIKKEKDRWDDNHRGTHNDNNNNNDNDNDNMDELNKREMSDSYSRLLLANTCRKQPQRRDSTLLVANACRKHQERDFMREMNMSDSMLVIPKRRCSDLAIIGLGLAITDKKEGRDEGEGEGEGPNNGNDNFEYKQQRNLRRGMSDSMLVIPKRRCSDLLKGLVTVNIEEEEEDDDEDEDNDNDNDNDNDEGHNNNNNDNDEYKPGHDFLRLEMSMSDTMLVIPKRRCSDNTIELAIKNMKKGNNCNDNNDIKYKKQQRDFIGEMSDSDSMLIMPQRIFSDLSKELELSFEINSTDEKEEEDGVEDDEDDEEEEVGHNNGNKTTVIKKFKRMYSNCYLILHGTRKNNIRKK